MVFNRKYYKLCFIIYMFINTLALGYLGIETNYLFVPLLIWAWYNGGRAVIIPAPGRSERRGIRALADRECQEEVAE